MSVLLILIPINKRGREMERVQKKIMKKKEPCWCLCLKQLAQVLYLPFLRFNRRTLA